MDQIINDLELPVDGNKRPNGDYVVDLQTSDNLSKVHSTISKLEYECEEKGIANEHSLVFRYYNDDYEIQLSANFDNDIYSLVISER